MENKTINWFEKKKSQRPILLDLIQDEEYFVEMETEDAIYFTDWSSKYCFFNKDEEGLNYKIIKHGKL